MIQNHSQLGQNSLIMVVYCLCYVFRSADLDGGNRDILITDTPYPFGIAIYEEHVYWWTWGNRRIERANRFTGLNSQVIYNSAQGMHTVYVHHPSKQPAG